MKNLKSSKKILIEKIDIYERLHAIRAAKSLHYTLKLFWDVIIQDKFIDNWHIPYICNELEYIGNLVVRREPKPYDLIINIPPGTSKSSIITILWDVYSWILDPSLVIINSSYSAGLSIDHAIKFNQIVHSDLFNDIFQPYYLDKYGKYLSFTKDTEGLISNNFGGSRISTSTGGTITGKHAHIIKRDDPIDPEQAESVAYRKRANRFNDRTLSSRKKQKEQTVTVTVMQRLHENDTTGHELKKKDKKIKLICLPAELSNDISPKELKSNYKNGLLDVNRLSRSILKDSKIDLGSYGYAGQYMQNPVPEGGGRFKKVWFDSIKEKQLPEINWDLWIDGAYTKNTANDPTGLMIAGVKNNKLYIKHAVSKHMDLPELLKFIPVYCEIHKLKDLARVYIEPKASGLSIVQMLKENTQLNPIKIQSKIVSEGKEARAQIASPRVESGRVVLVEGSWVDDFINQLISFPSAQHDEYIDLLGYAVDKYFSKRAKGQRIL